MLKIKEQHKKIFNILKVVISISLLFFLLWIMRDNLDDIFITLKNTNLFWYAASFVLHMIIMLILSYRMRIVFAISDVTISFKEAVQLNFIGYFFNNFLPTSAGGDVVKMYLSSRITEKNVESVVAILGDRIVGAYSIFLLAGVTLCFVYHDLTNRLISIIIWGVLIALTILLMFAPFLINSLTTYFNKKKIEIKFFPLERIKEIAYFFKERKFDTLKSIVLSIGNHVLSVVSVYFLTLGLNLTIPFTTLLWVIPLVFALNMLPSINGLGIREGAFIFFFGNIVGTESAFALSILWFSIYLLSDVIGGFIFLFSKNLRGIERLQKVNKI